ncbi:MAG: DNA polymerase III subunit gamma/tau [Planctomycetaceae bacterium]|nr:DNA polymerase III subunit gamma/tau [Planctomycetaceae bacterium]
MDVPYTALARRFRPQTFTEVVGQERIATTLRNAIVDGRVAHAYLFTGARGVGKTSMARIFAKALNCPNAVDAVPCNDCEICKSIAAGQDVDVSEIDGASNRGIDDIRLLRSNVNVRSMRSKYKVYIVDEVHMLTKEAFNALLKTLEEPPPGVKFVFCTTEPNKVPDTILSRCQRFDFGTIATDEIMTRLQQLADAEGFQVEPAALELVARRAAGSMRDSQSLFDQLLAFGSRKIVAADVHRLLGTAPDDRLVDLAQALLDRRSDAALVQMQTALTSGVQLEPFVDQLLSYFRDLMVLAAGATEVTLLSVSRDQQPRLTEQAEAWGVQTVIAALEILSETKQRMQRSTFGRALTDLALVRISLLRDLDQLDDLIASLKSGAAPVTVARPAAARGESRPSTPQLPAAQKKTLADGESESEQVANAPEESSPVIEWGPDCGPTLLAALQGRFVDITGTYLRQAHASAISGPNQLEILFPTRYDMGRRACERPEVLAKLESALQELTGKTVRLRFRAIQTDAELEPNRPAAAPAATNRRKTVEDPTDPLVAEVGRVFGVETWSVQEMVKTWSADGGDSES